MYDSGHISIEKYQRSYKAKFCVFTFWNTGFIKINFPFTEIMVSLYDGGNISVFNLYIIYFFQECVFINIK